MTLRTQLVSSTIGLPLVARGESTGTVKAARRAAKLRNLAELNPDRAEYYLNLVASLEHKLAALNACLGCGRVLRDPESIDRGYGSECWKQADHTV
jgi:hypothetical protein